MKTMRLIIPIALMLMLAFISGCINKGYFFNFRTEDDFVRDDGTWETQNSNYELRSDGLLISECWAAAPHFYDGDFTVTWKFSLNVVGGIAETLELFLTSKVSWEGADWYGGIVFRNMGTPSAGYSTYYNPGEGLVFPDLDLSYDGILDETGLNEVQLIKVGSWLTFKINGTSVGDGFAITGYDFDMLCPNTWCYQNMADHSILLRSVEVTFSGGQYLRL